VTNISKSDTRRIIKFRDTSDGQADFLLNRRYWVQSRKLSIILYSQTTTTPTPNFRLPTSGSNFKLPTSDFRDTAINKTKLVTVIFNFQFRQWKSDPFCLRFSSLLWIDPVPVIPCDLKSISTYVDPSGKTVTYCYDHLVGASCAYIR
jgi:hypothetical protein